MSSSVSLQAGLDALKQDRYQDAIGIFEALCQDSQPDARECLQARMHLVKTYQRDGQLEQALILCHQLAACSNAQVQIWAQQVMTSIIRGDVMAPLAMDSLASNTAMADSSLKDAIPEVTLSKRDRIAIALSQAIHLIQPMLNWVKRER